MAQFHDHEYVKGAKSGRNHNEEVTRHDHLGMVMDEGQPTLLWIGRAHRAVAQVPLHGSGRYSNPEFQFQLVGNALFSPCRILSAHLPDQPPKVVGQTRSPRRFRLPAPKEPEAFAVPTDERIRLHIHQRTAPLEHSAEGGHHPPGGIAGPSWFNLPLLEERQLLPKEEVLRSQGTAGMRGEETQSDQVDHDQGQ